MMKIKHDPHPHISIKYLQGGWETTTRTEGGVRGAMLDSALQMRCIRSWGGVLISDPNEARAPESPHPPCAPARN